MRTYIPTAATSTTSSHSTTTTAPAAPTGSGTITPGQGCKKYYTVASGDNCSVIDTKFGITLAQFIKWNPEINSQSLRNPVSIHSPVGPNLPVNRIKSGS